jgi:hypothetical protein
MNHTSYVPLSSVILSPHQRNPTANNVVRLGEGAVQLYQEIFRAIKG